MPGIELRDVEKGRASRLVARARLVWTDLQVGLATAGVVLLLLLQVKWISGLVDGFVDVDQLGTTVLVPVILVLILWQLVEVTQRLDSVENGVRTVTSDIYPAVLERIEATKNQNHQTLQVVGLTLRYAWPHIRNWIDLGRLDGWDIKISAYLPQEVEPWTPEDWAPVAEHQLRDIDSFRERGAVVRGRVRLAAFSYRHPPCVHGYLLGNGDIFMAYVSWTKDRTKLRWGAPRYEFVPHEDKSANAEAMRRLFAAWLEASQQRPFTAAVQVE